MLSTEKKLHLRKAIILNFPMAEKQSLLIVWNFYN